MNVLNYTKKQTELFHKFEKWKHENKEEIIRKSNKNLIDYGGHGKSSPMFIEKVINNNLAIIYQLFLLLFDSEF